MFRQRFLCSVPGNEGEFDDVGAVSKAAERGRWLIWCTVTFGTRVTPKPDAAMANWVKIELARWRMPGPNPAQRQVAMS